VPVFVAVAIAGALGATARYGLDVVGVETPDADGVLMEATSAPFGMGWTAFPGRGSALHGPHAHGHRISL